MSPSHSQPPYLAGRGDRPMGSLYAPEVKSACGAATLLAAIFGVPPDKVKARLGLPSRNQGAPLCSLCGGPMTVRMWESRHNPGGLCHKCWHESKYILVSCSQCGAPRERLASEIIRLTSKQGYQHFFCDQQCFGQWVGENHGFKAHPPQGGSQPKYDYNMVWQKHLETGLGAWRLSPLLGIPKGTINRVLSRERKALKAVKDATLKLHD